MGKTPVFGVVSFCWLGIALAGCDTCNTCNTVPKDRFQSRTTFGTTKDATVSKNAATDAAAKPKPPGVTAVEESAAKPPATGGMLPDTVGDRYDTIRRSGQRTPAEAGLVDAPLSTVKKPPTVPTDRPVTPVSATEAAAPGRGALSTTSAPLPAGPSEPVLPAGSTGVALPPPPGSSSPLVAPPSGTPLPPLNTDAPTDRLRGSTIQAPAAPVAVPVPPPPPPPPTTPTTSLKPLDPPAMKPVEPHAPIYDAPAAPPPPPLPTARSGDSPPPIMDAPPPVAAPGMPFIPGAPKQ